MRISFNPTTDIDSYYWYNTRTWQMYFIHTRYSIELSIRLNSSSNQHESMLSSSHKEWNVIIYKHQRFNTRSHSFVLSSFFLFLHLTINFPPAGTTAGRLELKHTGQQKIHICGLIQPFHCESWLLDKCCSVDSFLSPFCHYCWCVTGGLLWLWQ